MPDNQSTLDIAAYHKWKPLRRNFGSTFTGAKVKAMMAPMGEVADVTMNYIEENIIGNKGVFDVKFLSAGLAMNTIARCAFGLNCNAYKNQEHPLIKNGHDTINGFRTHNWLESVLFQVHSWKSCQRELLNSFPLL